MNFEMTKYHFQKKCELKECPYIAFDIFTIN